MRRCCCAYTGNVGLRTDSQSLGKPQSVAKIGQPRIYPPELFTSLNPIQVHHLPRSSTFREWLNSLKCLSKCGLRRPPSRGDWRETPTGVASVTKCQDFTPFISF